MKILDAIVIIIKAIIKPFYNEAHSVNIEWPNTHRFYINELNELDKKENQK